MKVATLPSSDLSGRAISPELALVDPALAAAARVLVPDPRPWPLASAETGSEGPSERRAPRRSRFAAVAATGVVALVACVLGFVLASSPGAADATAAARPSPQAKAARQARAARTYTWTAVPGAAAYEFQILRGQDGVFETTTSGVSVQLPASLRLASGRYTWLVTPRYENQSAVFVRRPIVEATFEVPRIVK